MILSGAVVIGVNLRQPTYLLTCFYLFVEGASAFGSLYRCFSVGEFCVCHKDICKPIVRTRVDISIDSSINRCCDHVVF